MRRDYPASDFALRGLALKTLHFDRTNVSDLSLLKGMPLADVECQGSGVTDLSPLKEFPLTHLDCDFHPERDAAILPRSRRWRRSTANRRPSSGRKWTVRNRRVLQGRRAVDHKTPVEAIPEGRMSVEPRSGRPGRAACGERCHRRLRSLNQTGGRRRRTGADE